MRDLLPLCHTVRTVGFPSYPDHHTVIPDAALDEALLAKQALIAELGLEGFTSTQMCFNVKRIEEWLRAASGTAASTVPVHLGVPGAVDRARLLSLGTRLGIGSSLRYLRKNSGAILRMFSPKSYDPNKLITPISRHADELNITALAPVHLQLHRVHRRLATQVARLIPCCLGAKTEATVLASRPRELVGRESGSHSSVFAPMEAS